MWKRKLTTPPFAVWNRYTNKSLEYSNKFRRKQMIELKIPAAEVRGFNYHPSYSTGAMEDWLLFDEEVWRRELTVGKKFFPGMNTIRIWLSWNAFCRGEKKFIDSIRRVMDICRELDLYVIPCLFNRWHDPMVLCDSIFIDHFLPDSSGLHKFGNLFED